MRRTLAAAAAFVVALVGSLIVSQYELAGLTGVVAGGLFGVAVGESVSMVARPPDFMLRIGAAVAASAGVLNAAWQFSGKDWHYVPVGGWLGVVVAPLATLAWLRGSGSRGAGSPPRR